MKSLIGEGKCKDVLRRMQKAVLSSSLNITWSLKVLCPGGVLRYISDGDVIRF